MFKKPVRSYFYIRGLIEKIMMGDSPGKRFPGESHLQFPERQEVRGFYGRIRTGFRCKNSQKMVIRTQVSCPAAKCFFARASKKLYGDQSAFIRAI
jgi:hypothetical protein